ncbi:MAG: NAD(P)/FAD-dependent oxidoreductase [Candidatus Faecousia sp.]|nr:NAD(P)/FAD-dependent oxidoreductase [Candidatus Faecousia sp.]
MERYDIAIIGTGPGGVSAAITAKVRGKNLILFGSRHLSEKLEKAHSILNYPGLPNVSGQELALAFREQLDSLEIPITEKQVTAVYAMGDYFALQTPEELVEARTVILAAGVVTAKPLPGENELLGRGISYCATCDAHFYRGKTVAVIGYSGHSCREADFLAESCEKVLYFPAAPHDVTVSPKVTVVRDKPSAILGQRQVTGIKTVSGAEYPVDGVFVLRDAVAPDKLVPGIQTQGNHIQVDLQMRTNLPGLFACGDVTGTPYQYVKAAGQGNVAALSAVAYLAEQKEKETKL